jgi:hypothetical protein
MTQAASAVFKIPTKSPQSARKAARSAGRPAPGRVLSSGTGRAATRGSGEVIELEYGITVYPARGESGRWHEDGERQQCWPVTVAAQGAARPPRAGHPVTGQESPARAFPAVAPGCSATADPCK